MDSNCCCDGKHNRLVGITKKRTLGAILSRALEADFLKQFKGAESNKMGSQTQFWGFDHVIAHFTHCTQQNDPQKEHLVIKVRISISYLTESKGILFKVIYWVLDLELLILLIWLSWMLCLKYLRQILRTSIYSIKHRWKMKGNQFSSKKKLFLLCTC